VVSFLNLASPEGKSWHVPISMASLHRVSTACLIFVSQDSQSANSNRTDKAVDACGQKRKRQLKAETITKAWGKLIEVTGDIFLLDSFICT